MRLLSAIRCTVRIRRSIMSPPLHNGTRTLSLSTIDRTRHLHIQVWRTIAIMLVSDKTLRHYRHRCQDMIMNNDLYMNSDLNMITGQYSSMPSESPRMYYNNGQRGGRPSHPRSLSPRPLSAHKVSTTDAYE
ncbi:hypothetical protein BGZ94_001056 [Podila epigama]|nr:hypothetical protein BGZ94_001056 [Podila epigama]